jgi:hypothetical protein
MRDDFEVLGCKDQEFGLPIYGHFYGKNKLALVCYNSYFDKPKRQPATSQSGNSVDRRTTSCFLKE